MKSKKYDMGGSLQQLLPLLDLAAPGLGTAASTVAGVLQQANAFNKQTTPLKSPTNPFRSYKDGGHISSAHNFQRVGKYTFDSSKIKKREDGMLVVRGAVNDIGNEIGRELVIERLKNGSYALKDEGLLEVGNNKFDPNEIKASKKGNYFIGKDIDTGDSFGLVLEDGKYRYKKSTDTSKLNVTKGKEYESLKPEQPATTSADLKLIQDNSAKYFKDLYNSPFYKRHQPQSVINERLNKLSKYDSGKLLTDPLLLSRRDMTKVELGENDKPSTIWFNPALKDMTGFKGSDNRTTMTHEFSHVMGETKKDLDLIRPKINRSNVENAHDEMPEERKADIDALRRSMKDRGIWDMKSDFNQQHLDKYRAVNPEGFDLNRIRRLIKSDDDMINLLNSVSYKDSKEQIPMARKGGMLPQLKFGGKLKEHSLPSHEQGGGMVDKMGNPSTQGTAEIEKQESIYTSQKGKTPYVFSDTLVDSNGKTFSQNAKSVEKKFNGKDQISKTTHKKLMDELMAKNEIAKKMQESVEQPEVNQMPFGGGLPGSQEYYDKNGALIQNDQLDSIINYDRTQAGYKNVLGNLQSGAFPRLPRVDKIPSGSMGILDNTRANPLVSQTPLDITQPIAQTTPTKNPLGSLDLGKVGGILKGVALAGSAIDAFQKPEEEQLRVPDFSKGDKAYAGLGGSFDPIRNDVVQQAKSGENQIMQSAGNFGQVMSRLNALQAGVGRNLAQVGLQEKQYNDQIRMSKGQREDNKAQITASEQIRKQTADSQNKAMGQDLVANLLQNVNNYGTEFMKQDVLTKTLAAQDVATQRAFINQLKMMNIKNPNFQIDEKLINSDNPLSAIKFIDNGSK